MNVHSFIHLSYTVFSYQGSAWMFKSNNNNIKSKREIKVNNRYCFNQMLIHIFHLIPTSCPSLTARHNPTRFANRSQALVCNKWGLWSQPTQISRCGITAPDKSFLVRTKVSVAWTHLKAAMCPPDEVFPSAYDGLFVEPPPQLAVCAALSQQSWLITPLFSSFGFSPFSHNTTTQHG